VLWLVYFEIEATGMDKTVLLFAAVVAESTGTDNNVLLLADIVAESTRTDHTVLLLVNFKMKVPGRSQHRDGHNSVAICTILSSLQCRSLLTDFATYYDQRLYIHDIYSQLDDFFLLFAFIISAWLIPFPPKMAV